MTLKEFFQRLPREGWQTTASGAIRRHRGDCIECPVTSLAKTPTNDVMFQFVADGLGLWEELMNPIMNAADNLTGRDPNLMELRQRLLQHCGISPRN